MIDLRFRPIERWPSEPTKHQQNAAFRATYQKTLDLLESELSKIGAKEIVVQAYFQLSQIRNDGWPYSSAKPSRSGVVLSFRNRRGSFSFPCDRYTAFEDNLRAIALSLEALRAVDRYGVTQRAEQYQGWKQIEPPGAGPAFANADEAARFLSIKAYGDDRSAAGIVQFEATRQQAYRSAAKLLHPDTAPGRVEEWNLLQQALAILNATSKGAQA